MNNSIQLPELVEILESQNAKKADYVASTGLVRMTNGMLVIPESHGGTYQPNEIMHQQLAEKLGIPSNYYKKMMELAPSLLEENVNQWLEYQSKPMMIRTFESKDGNIARAFLSNRYGILDNYDVLFKALQAIKEAGLEVSIKEANITDKRMYVYITAPSIQVDGEDVLRSYLRDSAVDYGIVAGLVLSNSEVGFGTYEISARALIKRCGNGLIVKDDSFRKVHLGAKLDAGKIEWSEQTKQKNFELVMSQTGDAIKQFLNEGYLNGVVQNLRAASKTSLEKPVDTVQNVIRHVSKTIPLTETNKNNILNYFVNDGDTKASGIVHALTREAQNMDADSKFDMESVAFELLPSIKTFDTAFVAGKN